MTRFGNPESFAVECVLVTDHGFSSEQPFGHIALRAGGVVLGHFDDIVMLSPVARAFRKFAGNQRRKNSDVLFPTGPEAAMRTLVRAVYEADGRDSATLKADYERFQPFLLCPNGSEAFDGWIALLIESAKTDRLVWRHPARIVQELVLPSGLLGRTLLEGADWIESLA